MQWFAVLICLLVRTVLFANDVQLVVFSYDRPLQLYAFLESLHYHAVQAPQTTIIYRCSDGSFRDGYVQVSEAFPQAKFIEQKNPPVDFQQLVLHEFLSSPEKYVIFAVDDIIVTGSIDFQHCIGVMEKANAYGFYFRLGKNVDSHWSGQWVGVPQMVEIQKEIYLWHFNSGSGDWAYPHTVDMTIYRKCDLELLMRQGSYDNPNFLEGYLSEFSKSVIRDRSGLSYATSRVFNLPLNIVSDSTSTENLGISSKSLMELFNAGFKIDIAFFVNFTNRSAHVLDVVPPYTLR